MVGPALLVAIAAAVLGFVVQRYLTSPVETEHVGISVIALPSTPDPPSPSPEPTAQPRVRVNGRSSGGRSDGAVSNCPAGCTCEARPPGGVVILCR
jgi:hypothetical protein